jgi:hypothetical protein
LPVFKSDRCARHARKLYTKGTSNCVRRRGRGHTRSILVENGWREITKEPVRILILGGPGSRAERRLDSGSDSARASVRKLGLVFLVPTRCQSNHAPELLFHEPFIPQLRDCHTSRRGIEGLPRQSQKLTRVLFIAHDKRDKESVLDVLPCHDAMLCTSAGLRNGSSVPVCGYLRSLFIWAGTSLEPPPVWVHIYKPKT